MKFVIINIFLSISFFANGQYSIDDFGSTTSGNWSDAGTWSVWNGATWGAVGTTPSSGNNVFILAGKTVILTAQSQCGNLDVEFGAKLWAANTKFIKE